MRWTIDTARIAAAWPGHVRAHLPLHRRPDVRRVVAAIIVPSLLLAGAIVVIELEWATASFAATIVLAAAMAGPYIASTAWSVWSASAEAALRSVEGRLWSDGDRVEAEVSGGALRYRTSLRLLTLPLPELVGATRIGETIFVWTSDGTFLPIDGGTCQEGDLDGFAAALAAARRAPSGPPASPVPEGALGIVVDPPGPVALGLSSLVFGYVASPRTLAFPLFAVATMLAGAWLEATLVERLGGLLLLMLLLRPASLGVAGLLAWWRTRHAGPVELAMADGVVHLWSTSGGQTWPSAHLVRVWRWPTGAVWIHLGQEIVLLPPQVRRGNRAAFLSALEAERTAGPP